MADPIAVIIRFKGDPEDLFERFERARRMWIEAQDSDYERPTFYAACKSEERISIVNVWQTAAAHRAFGQGLHSHIDAVGMGAPDADQQARLGLRPLSCGRSRALNPPRQRDPTVAPTPSP